MASSSDGKRNGHVPDTRYVCATCGMRIEHSPIYIHELVWHGWPAAQAQRQADSEEPRQQSEHCWLCGHSLALHSEIFDGNCLENGCQCWLPF